MQRLRLALSAAFFCLLLAGPAAPAFADEAADVASVHAFIDSIATRFNSGDLEDFINVFTDDAEIISQGYPDIVGKQAIHDVYASAMAQYGMKVSFHTTEVRVAGDMAYEAGTYQVSYSDKASGKLMMSTQARHVHILLRQPDGSWRTWRMITNTAAQPAPAQSN